MSLQERLIQYLRKVWLKNPNIWVHKGVLEQLAKDAGYLAETINRQMRLLVEENKIERRQKGISQELRYCPDITEISNNIDKLI